jgi:hypothetical protein
MDQKAEQERPKLDLLIFWVAAALAAVVFWWPLVLEPRGGLHGGDVYTYYFPLKAWYADRLKAGELPLWNPLVGHGFPALGESQTGVFYPFNLLLYRFLSLNAAYNANFLLHYVLAFGFSCLYVRRLGFSLLEALLAAVVFVYGWFPARSCLEWAIVTGAWMPLALWGAECFLLGGGRRFLLATQLALVMQLLAGHFHLAFITLLLLALYAPLRWLSARQEHAISLRRIGGLALAAVLACALAGIQLVPSWELKGRSQRGGEQFRAQQLNYGSIPAPYLLQTVQPWRHYPHVNEPAFETEYFGNHNTNKVEAHLYFGIIALVLAAVGVLGALLAKLGLVTLTSLRVTWVWLAIGVAGVLLATGWWTRWASVLPGFGYFTGPGRYGLLTQFAVAVLAAAGARVGRAAIGALAARSAVLAWAAVLGVVTALVLVIETWTAWAGGLATFCESFVLVRLGFGPQHLTYLALAATAALLVLAAYRRTPDLLGTIACLALAWIDLALVAPYVQFADLRADSPIHLRESSKVGDLLRDRPGARVLARNQNAVSLCGAATVPVYLGIGPAEYFNGPLRLPGDFAWDRPLSADTLGWMRRTGVTHILAFESMEHPSLGLVWAGYDPFLHGILGRSPLEWLWLYEVQSSPGRAYGVPAGPNALSLAENAESPSRVAAAQELHIAANTIEFKVESDQPGLAVLTDLKYPGWNVYVDGQPAVPASDTVLRAVRVDAGRHKIRWVYRPRSLAYGILMSLAGVTAAGLLWRHRLWRAVA